MQPTRVRTLTDQPCPRCGISMEAMERGITFAQEPQPVRWVVDRRYCPAGCVLTVDDFPSKQTGRA